MIFRLGGRGGRGGVHSQLRSKRTTLFPSLKPYGLTGFSEKLGRGTGREGHRLFGKIREGHGLRGGVATGCLGKQGRGTGREGHRSSKSS